MNSIRKLLVPVSMAIGLLWILAIPAAAQNHAIAGKVTDEKGQPVADAQITIQQTDVVRSVTTKTNKKGEYQYLLGMQAGMYRVVVRKAGYEPQYQEHIRPALGETAQVDFKLEPGKDHKLPFEMTAAELEQFKAENAQIGKTKQFSAEVKAHFDQGVLLSDQGKYAEAVDEFNKALEKDSKQPGILARLGDADSKMGKNEDALAAYEKAVALEPTNAELLINMGVLLNKMGKVAESQEAFKKAAAANPSSSAQSFYDLGVTMFNSGHTDEAVDSFKKAIAADPNSAEAYFQLGICLSAKTETMPAAIEAMKKYIEIGKKPDQIDVAKLLIKEMGGK
jgi:tetratricopeptide (TPR) repeat protein